MANQYSATIFFGEKFAEINCRKGQDPVVRQQDIINADEHAALHLIVEILRCLSSGKNIDHHFNPTVDHITEDELVMCRWETKSGKLRELGAATRHYRHAETLAEAVKRHRNFTCPKSLVAKLPKRRTQEMFSPVQEKS